MMKELLIRVIMLINMICDADLSAAEVNQDFIDAARAGDLERIESFLQQGVSVDSIDNGIIGWSALWYAAGAGHYRICQKLIDHGADVRYGISSGMSTPLHSAAANSQVEICRLLLDNGACVVDRTSAHQSPLGWSLGYGHYKCAHMLLENGADINEIDALNITHLESACDVHWRRNNATKKCRWLIAHGADVNFINPRHADKKSPLMYALFRNALSDIIQQLLQAGADVHYVTNDGNFVADYCASLFNPDLPMRARNFDNWFLLIDSGAYVNPKYLKIIQHSPIKRPLWNGMMISKWSPAAIARWLSQAKKNLLLRYAVIQGDVALVKDLLAAGAHPLAGKRITIYKELMRLIQKLDNHSAAHVQDLNRRHREIFGHLVEHISALSHKDAYIIPDLQHILLTHMSLMREHDDNLAKALVGFKKERLAQEKCCEIM